MKQPEKWFQIRHDLYKHVQARVRQRIGRESRELKSYRMSLERDFSRKWQACEVKDLFKRVNNSDVIFLSDFHALKQSQKTHLRILKRVSLNRPVILAVECVEAAHQKEIDSFLKGQIEEGEFLKRIHWNENWGFPWENYKPLFDWAKQKNIPVVGLNTSEKNPRMKSRDVFAAKKVMDLQKATPDARIFVICGDLHLASSHLPKLVQTKGKKNIRILQNSERIYFQILKRANDREIEVVRLDRDSYCILNVPPWVKWQNYLMFLEETYDQGLDENLDFTDHVMSFIKLLCKELELEISYSDLSVYSSGDKSFWEKIEDTCSSQERATVIRMIDEEIYFYLAGSQLGYLSRGSVNQAASLGMEYIVCKMAGLQDNVLVMPNDFTKWIWLKGWAYFGGKLINPKRKTDTLLDMKTRLTSRTGEQDREPLQLALAQKVSELIGASTGRIQRLKFKPKRKNSYVVAAELLGGLMGERLYEAYIREKLKPAKIQEFLTTPLDGSDFEKNYLAFVKFIEKTPLSFKSKEEKI